MGDGTGRGPTEVRTGHPAFEGWAEAVAAHHAAKARQDEADRARWSLASEDPRSSAMRRYNEVRAALAADGRDPDRVMLEEHPALLAEVLGFEREHAVRGERSQSARQATRASLDAALAILGAHVGSTLSSRDDLLPFEVEREACTLANGFRWELDGVSPTVIGTGAFARSLADALASSRSKGTTVDGAAAARVLLALRQPVHVVADADTAGVLALSEVAHGTDPAFVASADVSRGRRRFALRVGPDDAVRVVTALRAHRGYADVEATVRDPGLCDPAPDGPRPSPETLDDGTLAGEVGYLTWAVATRPRDVRLASALEMIREVQAERADMTVLDL